MSAEKDSGGGGSGAGSGGGTAAAAAFDPALVAGPAATTEKCMLFACM